MGVDTCVLDFLLDFKGQDLGDTLWLGRQGLHIAPDDAAAAAVLSRHGMDASVTDIAGSTGYAEELFRRIGSRTVVSADNSPYEGAEIIHDLNQPAPPELHERFDCVFDGGTLEHVYSIPTAFESVKRMLKPGGLFLSVNGANNWLGHGFYQFSPELMWRAFGTGSGFEVVSMKLGSMRDGMPLLEDALDPAESGARYEFGTTPVATYIMVGARKIDREASGAVYQSDYQTAWDRGHY